MKHRRVDRERLLEALRAGPSVDAAARAVGCRRQHVYRLAGSDAEVAAALRALRSRGGQGRPRVVGDLALTDEELLALVTRLRGELYVGTAASQVDAAARLLEIARARHTWA